MVPLGRVQAKKDLKGTALAAEGMHVDGNTFPQGLKL
jgi:hypothetical protein